MNHTPLTPQQHTFILEMMGTYLGLTLAMVLFALLLPFLTGRERKERERRRDEQASRAAAQDKKKRRRKRRDDIIDG